MATILIKRNYDNGTKPTVTELDFGELAVNVADGKLFTKILNNNIEEIVEIGGGTGGAGGELVKITGATSGETGYIIKGRTDDNIGENAVNFGIDTVASGINSLAEGRATQAVGGYSHAEGEGTQAFGHFSHAEGLYTQAIGIDSHSEGTNTLATNGFIDTISNITDYSVDVTTPDQFYISEYITIEPNDKNSFYDYEIKKIVDKQNNTIYFDDRIITSNLSDGNKIWSNNGTGTHVEGRWSLALNNAAHAEGDTTRASGEASHAEGFNTIAQNDYMHASGKYNKGTSPDTIYEVGVGTADTNRRNAFEIYTSGQVRAPLHNCSNIHQDPKNLITYEYLTAQAKLKHGEVATIVSDATSTTFTITETIYNIQNEISPIGLYINGIRKRLGIFYNISVQDNGNNQYTFTIDLLNDNTLQVNDEILVSYTSIYFDYCAV